MKVVNNRGKVLLDVYSATYTHTTVNGLGYPEKDGILYQYRGEGCGGNTSLPELQSLINCIIADNRSAKVIGTLPEPTLWDNEVEYKKVAG